MSFPSPTSLSKPRRTRGDHPPSRPSSLNFSTASEMSHAEDIIFCGKLVPYRNHHQIRKSLSAEDATRFSSRSPIELHPSRNRHTMDRRRWDLVRSDGAADICRSVSKSSARSEGSSRALKPSWFVLMSCPLRLIQPEINLRDIKSRRGQRRRPGSMFPSADTLSGAGGKIPARRKSFWGFDLLRVLSCKSHASVAVTASVGRSPRF